MVGKMLKMFLPCLVALWDPMSIFFIVFFLGGGGGGGGVGGEKSRDGQRCGCTAAACSYIKLISYFHVYSGHRLRQ